jgi:acetylornithine deacetylase
MPARPASAIRAMWIAAIVAGCLSTRSPVRTLLGVDAEILAAVAAEQPAMVDLLEDLVAAPTLLGEEASGQTVMRRAFTALGLEPVDVPLDAAALAAHPAGAPHSWPVDGKANVVADWHGPGGGRSLVLNGHVDVVSPEPTSLWTGDPFAARVDGDWLYGRGAGDMKSGLAAIVGAVRGLQRLGLRPRGRVQLQSVVEEECTGNGALACVLAGHTADAAIITEPTRGAIWTAQVGVLWFQVHVIGAPAHAGEAAEGANAIEASCAIIAALRELETELNAVRPPLYAAYPHPINLNVGMIRGGDWPSTVAGECVTHCRLAQYPGQPIADIRAQVERTVRRVADEHPSLAQFRTEVRYDGFQCEGYELDPDAPLVEALGDAAARVHGSRPPLYPSTATTDARSFQLYGDTPAVCFGPYAEHVHAVDERVHLPSVTTTAQALALFIADWCGLTPA